MWYFSRKIRIYYVGVLENLCEHDVAEVQKGGELGDREVPHAPGVLILVGDAGIKDEAPPLGCCLVYGTKGLDGDREGQPRRTISTTPRQVQVANLGPSAILAASLRAQLA